MSDFYRDKKVVVIGGAGMIGVQLTTLLVQAGADVAVLDNFSRGQNKVKGAYYIGTSATDPLTCEYAFRDLRRNGDPCFAVFNLAAKVAGVFFNQDHQHEMFLENARLQITPLMVADKLGVENFLQVSSVCIYDTRYNHPCREENGHVGRPEEANFGYGMAKRIGEEMALLSRGIKHLVIVRPSNVFGPHDYFDEKAHVIPALIKRAVYEDSITVYSDREIIREFIFSRDVAKGMMYALEYGTHQSVYNIGTNGETRCTIEELVETIQQAAGTNKPVYYVSNQKSTGDRERYSDTSKLNGLGWKHEVSLMDGLKETVEWYKHEQL